MSASPYEKIPVAVLSSQESEKNLKRFVEKRTETDLK